MLPSRRLIRIHHYISTDCCINALEALILGQNACRKASLGRLGDSWGYCHLEGGVNRPKMRKRKPRK